MAFMYFANQAPYLGKLLTFVYDSFRRRIWPDKFGLRAGKPSAFSMNRRDLVLAVLAAADGRPYSPVQIQKAIFVICDQMPDLINDGLGFNFQPYDYGPFDSDVYSELQYLARGGDVVIAPSASGNWSTYAASDVGVKRGNNLLYDIMTEGQQSYVNKISAWVRSLSFQSLVKSIYEAYPDMRANSIFRG